MSMTIQSFFITAKKAFIDDKSNNCYSQNSRQTQHLNHTCHGHTTRQSLYHQKSLLAWSLIILQLATSSWTLVEGFHVSRFHRDTACRFTRWDEVYPHEKRYQSSFTKSGTAIWTSLEDTSDSSSDHNEEEEEEQIEEQELISMLAGDVRGRPAGVVIEDLTWRIEKLKLEEANTKRFLKAGPRFLPYAECRKWVQAWGNRWKSEKEWNNWIAAGEKRNSYIPSRPEEYYTRTGEWISWDHFLGVSSSNDSRDKDDL